MPRLLNWEPYPVVPNIHRPAVPPGGTYDFTDEQVAAGITGRWSTEDPSACRGLQSSPRLSAARDHRSTASGERATSRTTDPALRPEKEK